MRDTKNLRVLQRAHALAVRVDAVTAGPQWRKRAKLVSQLRNSAQSVPANITEGCGHSSRLEYARFLQQALASNAETSYHLKFARDVNALSIALHAECDNENIVVRRMLAKLLRVVREELREDKNRKCEAVTVRPGNTSEAERRRVES